jgi:ceramide glucosyltransferase
MSALMRKSVLDDAGGIKAFGCYLAEDYFFAKEFLKKGLKLDISSQPALQNPGNCTVGVFQSRLTR